MKKKNIVSRIAESFAFYMSEASKPPTDIVISKEDLADLISARPEALDGNKFMGLTINVKPGAVMIGRRVDVN